jgi:osmotically-inducible protein OsmY
MRRFLFGVVIASVTAAMPVGAFGGDREIAQTVMAELQQHKAAGHLKGFDIDLKVEGGVVYLSGIVASQAQRDIVERAAINEVGRANLVNELQIQEKAPEAIQEKAPEALPVRPTMIMPVVNTEESDEPTDQDVALTDAIIGKLAQSKSAGELKGFDLDVSTTQGDVWVKGTVANQAQKDLVLDIARRTRGVTRVIDDVVVKTSSPIRQVSTGAPAPIPQGSSMPVTGRPIESPQAFAPSGLASYGPAGCVDGGYVSGGPVPIQGAGGEYGAGAPRYDQPNLPSYAWPSYAAHPNYAAVTYPKQYSPSAWPYIGPFYPYPQVPLGWRKVALEWDDGLWYLDFTSK